MTGITALPADDFVEDGREQLAHGDRRWCVTGADLGAPTAGARR